jgi:hypothetical protein
MEQAKNNAYFNGTSFSYVADVIIQVPSMTWHMETTQKNN